MIRHMVNRGVASPLLQHGSLAIWDARVMSYLKLMEDRGTTGMSRVEQLLKNSVIFSSSYSGIDAPREAWRILSLALSKELGVASPTFKGHHVVSCDVLQYVRDVLQEFNMKEDEGRGCIHCDIISQMDEIATAFVHSLQAETAGDDAEQRLVANKQIEEFLAKNTWAFQQELVSWCVSHGRPCPVWPLFAWRCALAEARGGAGCQGFPSDGSAQWKRQRCSRKPWWAFSPRELGYVMLLDDDEDQSCSEPLVIDMSSPVCTDWSLQGKCEGEGGVSEPANKVYMAKRKAAARLKMEHMFSSSAHCDTQS